MIPTYYIQNKKGVCINANKIKGVKDYCLPEQTVRMHLKLERMKMQEDTSYKPRPLVFSVGKDKLKEMILEVKKKAKDLIGEDHIALQLQSHNLPVILIVEKKENETKTTDSQ